MLSTTTSTAPPSASRISDDVGDGGAIVRPGADFHRLLEAIRSSPRDDESWAGNVTEAFGAVLARPANVGLQVIEHDRAFGQTRTMFESGHRACARSLAQCLESLHGSSALHRVYSMATLDSVAIVAYPQSNVSVLVGATFARGVTLSPHDRRVLSRIALHVESSYRLRHKPENTVARVWDDGRVLPTSEAASLWSKLVSGDCCLVARRNDGDGSYVVLENAPESHHRRALTRGERDVLSMAMRGLSTKVIAYELGMTSSGVSNRLVQAATKLGVATRTDLLRLARSLSRDKVGTLVDSALTVAERDVLSMVRCGMSNGEIAEARSRSVRTVANQVASVLRKTRSPSRRALLVARVREGG